MITREFLQHNYEYRDGKLLRKFGIRGKPVGSEIGTLHHSGRIQAIISGRHHLLHRLVWAYHHGWLPEFIDHIDGDPLNNRIENLRPASRSENTMNSRTRSDNASGVKGVCWKSRERKWCARVHVKGKDVWSGMFDCLNEAKAAVAKAREIFHGEFANAGN